MKIYRRLSQFGSKLAIILQEPLRSTIPFIPPCVTREKYFTARCAKPLHAIAAHLTAVYHSCAGYLIFKILCPLLIENWESHFAQSFLKSLDKRTKTSTCNCVCCRCCKSIICQFGLTAIFITNNGRKALVIEKKIRNIDFVPSVCYNSKYFVGGAT